MAIFTSAQYTITDLNDGVKGDKGEASILAVLDNDSHIVPTDVTGGNGNYTGAVSTIAIFRGTQEETSKWVVTTTPSEGVVGTLEGNTYTVTDILSSVDQGTVDFVATFKDTTINKRFTIAKSKKGAVGENPKLYFMDTDASHLQRDSLSKKIEPKEINVSGMSRVGDEEPTAQLGYFVVHEQARKTLTPDQYHALVTDNVAIPDVEYVLSDLANPYVERYRSDNPESVLKYIVQTDALSIKITWYKDKESLHFLDVQTLPVLSDGLTTYIHLAYATNETGTQGFSTTDSVNKRYIGQYTDFIESGSEDPSKYKWTLIKGDDGTSTYLWVRYSKSSNGADMSTNPTGASYMGTTTTDTPVPPALYSAYQWVKFVGGDGIPGVKGDDGQSSYLHIKYSNDGGLTFTGNGGEDFGDYIGKRIDNTLADSATPSDYTWGKITGEDATSYQLLLSPKLVKKTATGVLDATTFTATGKSQKGVGDMNNYAGRFTIEEDIGAGYVRKYTSVGNEISKAYSISSSAKSYRVRLYLAGDTSVLLDEETLTVVSDGATGSTGASGTNAVLLSISTPDGDIIKNHTGNLKAVAELFEGINLVNATTYQWYARNPGGTGDTDSGAGWDKLTTGVSGGTTGFTTKTLTITPSAISGTATFMVIAVYKGAKLRRQVTVQDITDTYTFATLGNGTFKNGQGVNTFTQKVYQDGVEVDSTGAKFRYQWNLYANDGTMNPTFVKVGKSITLLSTDYLGKGYLYCTVSD